MDIRRRAVLLALTSALWAAPGWPASLKGVEVPDTVQVEGRTLVLQGLGLRKRFLLSAYVAALYLSTATADPAVAVSANEPKRISLHFLRGVGADHLEETFREGFFNNAQERLDRLGPRLDAFVRLFAGGVEAGQAVALTYTPGRGVSVAVGGEERGVVEGRDFMEALWAVWLGAVPVDHGLKRGMLGGR